MEKTLKDLLRCDDRRSITGGYGKAKLYLNVDEKGMDVFIVTYNWGENEPGYELYRGIDEEEAVKIFREND